MSTEWNCVACTVFNSPHLDKCALCVSPRPTVADTISWWKCFACQAFNRPTAYACSTCHALRTDHWQCFPCTSLNLPDDYVCIQCRTMRGNWICGVCEREHPSGQPCSLCQLWICQRCASKPCPCLSAKSTDTPIKQANEHVQPEPGEKQGSQPGSKRGTQASSIQELLPDRPGAPGVVFPATSTSSSSSHPSLTGQPPLPPSPPLASAHLPPRTPPSSRKRARVHSRTGQQRQLKQSKSSVARGVGLTRQHDERRGTTQTQMPQFEKKPSNGQPRRPNKQRDLKLDVPSLLDSLYHMEEPSILELRRSSSRRARALPERTLHRQHVAKTGTGKLQFLSFPAHHEPCARDTGLDMVMEHAHDAPLCSPAQAARMARRLLLSQWEATKKHFSRSNVAACLLMHRRVNTKTQPCQPRPHKSSSNSSSDANVSMSVKAERPSTVDNATNGKLDECRSTSDNVASPCWKAEVLCACLFDIPKQNRDSREYCKLRLLFFTTREKYRCQGISKLLLAFLSKVATFNAKKHQDAAKILVCCVEDDKPHRAWNFWTTKAGFQKVGQVQQSMYNTVFGDTTVLARDPRLQYDVKRTAKKTSPQEGGPSEARSLRQDEKRQFPTGMRDAPFLVDDDEGDDDDDDDDNDEGDDEGDDIDDDDDDDDDDDYVDDDDDDDDDDD